MLLVEASEGLFLISRHPRHWTEGTAPSPGFLWGHLDGKAPDEGPPRSP